jgi:hypothetical protein
MRVRTNNETLPQKDPGMKRFLIIIFTASLAGCTVSQQAFVATVQTQAESAADIKLKADKWVYCSTQTTGAFFRNPDRADMTRHCFPERKP